MTPRRAARWLRARLGRRGIFLLVLGVGKTAYGVGFIVSPLHGAQGLRLLTDVCSLQSWAWLWIVAGIVTTGSAFLRIGRDWLGFFAAFIPPSVWAIAYAAAAVSGYYSRGVWAAIWFLTSHIGVILWASGVPEHSVPPLPRKARRGTAR